jgi:hypothetical protein
MPNTTVRFTYADATFVTMRTGGYILAGGTTWADVVSQNDNSFLPHIDNYDYAIYLQEHSTSDKWVSYYSNIWEINTSSLAGKTIISAKLYLYASANFYNIPVAPTVNVYGATGTQYENRLGVAFSTAKPTTDFVASTWLSYTLNSAGMAAVSLTGNTYFSFRMNYDVSGTPPWSLNGMATAMFHRDTVGYKPYLEVIYTTDSLNNQIVTGLRHIYNRKQDDLEITFGGYSTAEDILAPKIMKMVDDVTIPQITEPPKIPPVKPFEFGGGESSGSGATRKW